MTGTGVIIKNIHLLDLQDMNMLAVMEEHPLITTGTNGTGTLRHSPGIGNNANELIERDLTQGEATRKIRAPTTGTNDF